MGLGSTLKKAVKSVVKNPVNLVFPTSLGTTDVLKKAAGGGGIYDDKAGPANPFSAMPNGFLSDTSKLDFLKDTSKYDFLKDPSKISTFASTYKKPTGTADSLFEAYLGNINAPSSVDSVRGEVDSEMMRNLLAGVDIDTKNSIGSLKSDFADRGLSAPGVISDIEGNSLAQAYGDADRTRAGIRGEYAGKELDRLKAKEDALRTAYGARYSAGVSSDAMDKQIAASGAMTDSAAANDMMKVYAQLLSGKDDLFAQLLNNRDLGMAGINSTNYNAGEDRRLKYAEPSYLDKLFDKINIGIGI